MNIRNVHPKIYSDLKVLSEEKRFQSSQRQDFEVTVRLLLKCLTRHQTLKLLTFISSCDI